MSRSFRAGLADETIEIVRLGGYENGVGNRVSIVEAMERAVHGTKVLGLTAQPNCGDAEEKGACAVIEVTSESTLEAIYRLNARKSKGLGCLNFASAKNPGGGFMYGAQAQEEVLARSSGLYKCLLSAPEFYKMNRKHSSSLYLDLAIVSPGVPFFRDDKGQLIDHPVLATVITAPAPNAGAIKANEPDRIPDVEPTLRNRAALVLQVAEILGIRNLVLGAWGCGVFRNDPLTVACAFADLLKPGKAYSKSFEHVVFAIFDPNESGESLAAFRREFA